MSSPAQSTATESSRAKAFASPVDTELHGAYRITQSPDDPRPLCGFTGRIGTNGSSPFAAEADRYHGYTAAFARGAIATLDYVSTGRSGVRLKHQALPAFVS
ncbi:hypothetical protein ACMTN4_00620 (plasmid) [Rhodococcus globerulus]|uniref:hypothetical protein n=1 Tax=Rhodococcus globerulus TaxID=33008 RepID=UPI0039E75583